MTFATAFRGLQLGRISLACLVALSGTLSSRGTRPTASRPCDWLKGGNYTAFAVIFDAAPVRVRFTIRQGRAVELPEN